MSSSKCSDIASKVPKLSEELLLEEDNEVDCDELLLQNNNDDNYDGEHSNENAILHIDEHTVTQKNSFDCKDVNDNSKETIVILIHPSMTEGYTSLIHSQPVTVPKKQVTTGTSASHKRKIVGFLDTSKVKLPHKEKKLDMSISNVSVDSLGNGNDAPEHDFSKDLSEVNEQDVSKDLSEVNECDVSKDLSEANEVELSSDKVPKHTNDDKQRKKIRKSNKNKKSELDRLLTLLC